MASELGFRVLEVNNADQELANVVNSLQEATQSHLLRTKKRESPRKNGWERGKRGNEGEKGGRRREEGAFRKCPVILLDDLDANLFSSTSFASGEFANRSPSSTQQTLNGPNGPNVSNGPNGSGGSNGSLGSLGSSSPYKSLGTFGSTGPYKSLGTFGSTGPYKSLGTFGSTGPYKPLGTFGAIGSSSLSSSLAGGGRSIASVTALESFAVYSERVSERNKGKELKSSQLRPGYLKSVKQLVLHSKCPVLLTASAPSVQLFLIIKHRAKSLPLRPISCSSPNHRSPRLWYRSQRLPPNGKFQ